MSENVVVGRVVDLCTGRGVGGMSISCMDRERRLSDPLGTATTDDEGGFRIDLNHSEIDEWLARRCPEAVFEVSDHDQLLLRTDEMVVWVPDDESDVVIEVDQSIGEPWLEVGSFAELMEHEAEIVGRITAVTNGGNLFMAHPLMLLRDIGVRLSDEARHELLEREPRLETLSPQPYLALKRDGGEQRVRFHLQGLFERS